MARVFVFADESGNFVFSKATGASKYFILATVTAPTCAVGDSLLALKRDLAFENHALQTEFHCAEEQQIVRERVFACLAMHDFRVDLTIIEKARTNQGVRSTHQGFYQRVWYLHMRNVLPHIVKPGDDLLVVGASLGTKKDRAAFHQAASTAVTQLCEDVNHRTAFWAAISDACLQVADYCAWAVQRKWERNDDRSYVLIQDKIVIENQPFKNGELTY